MGEKRCITNLINVVIIFVISKYYHFISSFNIINFNSLK